MARAELCAHLARFPTAHVLSLLSNSVLSLLPSKSLKESKEHRLWKEILPRLDDPGFQLHSDVYAFLLRDCGNAKALSDGERVHNHIIQRGLEQDVFLANVLVYMYGSCGAVETALELFNGIHLRDQFSWNFIINAYVRHGMYKEALQLFDQMQRESFMPDRFVFASMLSACTTQATLAQGKRMHASLRSSGFESDVVVGNALVNMYSRCGSLEDSWNMFGHMPEHDSISWTALIAACVQNGQGKNALRLFSQMQQEGVIIDKILLSSVLDACASIATLADGKRAHARLVASTYGSDLIVGTSLINMYGACGALKDACRTFDQMHQRDVISWSAIIAAYANPMHAKDALQLFYQMQQEGVMPDKITFISILSACATKITVSEGKQMHSRIVGCAFELDGPVGNALLSMYSKCGSLNDAWIIFEKMPEWDNATFLSILSVCGSKAALAEGKHIHASIAGCGVELDLSTWNAVVNLYGKCGKLQDAQRMFDMMPVHDIVSLNAMIGAFALSGRCKEAFQLFDQMQMKGIMPNQVTFVSILSTCSHAGLVDQGCSYFYSMNPCYSLIPIADHYNCMIDLLGRAGQLDEAEDLLNRMTIPPSAVSWMTMLSACRVNADVERGERAAKHVFALDPENFSPYIVLSNLYVRAGREDDALMLIDRMWDKGLNMPPDLLFEDK